MPMPSSALLRRRSYERLTGVLVAVLLAGSLAPSLARSTSRPLATGLSLSGPLTEVTLCTKYSYRVQVVSSQSYQQAYVSFFVPPYRTMRRVRLVAHRPWRGVFTAEFTALNYLSKGIDVGVMALPPHRGLKLLVNEIYAVSPAASQPANPPQFCGNAPPPSFGS
jgi:hypothetical protein